MQTTRIKVCLTVYNRMMVGYLRINIILSSFHDTFIDCTRIGVVKSSFLLLLRICTLRSSSHFIERFACILRRKLLIQFFFRKPERFHCVSFLLLECLCPHISICSRCFLVSLSESTRHNVIAIQRVVINTFRTIRRSSFNQSCSSSIFSITALLFEGKTLSSDSTKISTTISQQVSSIKHGSLAFSTVE